jgi:uncharacterized membrane protein
VEALEDRNLPSGFVFTTLDDPNAATTGGTGTFPAAINDSGQIVGTFFGSDARNHGFLLSQGQYTTLDYPGSHNTHLTGINDEGEIVGYADHGPSSLAFELSHGQYTALPNIKGKVPTPLGINSLGEIVGTYNYPFNMAKAFLLRDGQYYTFNAPNATDTFLSDANDLGQGVGSYQDATFTVHGFQLQNGRFTPIAGPPGAHKVTPNAINDLGTVVGFYNAAAGDHGFVESDGQYITFNVPNSFPGTTDATGINAFGQVAGYYATDNGGLVYHGFLTTSSNGALPQSIAPDPGLLTSLENLVGMRQTLSDISGSTDVVYFDPTSHDLSGCAEKTLAENSLLVDSPSGRTESVDQGYERTISTSLPSGAKDAILPALSHSTMLLDLAFVDF